MACITRRPHKRSGCRPDRTHPLCGEVDYLLMSLPQYRANWKKKHFRVYSKASGFLRISDPSCIATILNTVNSTNKSVKNAWIMSQWKILLLSQSSSNSTGWIQRHQKISILPFRTTCNFWNSRTEQAMEQLCALNCENNPFFQFIIHSSWTG